MLHPRIWLACAPVSCTFPFQHDWASSPAVMAFMMVTPENKCYQSTWQECLRNLTTPSDKSCPTLNTRPWNRTWVACSGPYMLSRTFTSNQTTPQMHGPTQVQVQIQVQDQGFFVPKMKLDVQRQMFVRFVSHTNRLVLLKLKNFFVIVAVSPCKVSSSIFYLLLCNSRLFFK